MHSKLRLGLAVAAAAVTAEAGLIHLGRTYGSTEEERKKLLPGDDIIADAEVQTDHAITIDAPPSAVWPWLVQMGWAAVLGTPLDGWIGCCSRTTGPVRTESCQSSRTSPSGRSSRTGHRRQRLGSLS